MRYSVEIIRENEQNTSTWSGGTTTELAIYPKGASYKDRNFAWRLSSANVDLEESSFTSLPGIWRYIMVIEGEMDLEHEGHHKAHLKPFDQDSFSGGWITKSKGKVKDFNLMLTEGYKGKVEAICVNEGVNIIEAYQNQVGNYFIQAIYCVDGEVEIEINKKQIIYISKGDLVIIRLEANPTDVEVRIASRDNKASIIKANIYK